MKVFEFIKSLDHFGKPVTEDIKINNKKVFKTFVGGVLSILCFLIIGYHIYHHGLLTIKSEQGLLESLEKIGGFIGFVKMLTSFLVVPFQY